MPEYTNMHLGSPYQGGVTLGMIFDDGMRCVRARLCAAFDANLGKKKDF